MSALPVYPVVPVAIFLADIHLSHTPPVCRQSEPSWYEAQKRVLLQVRNLADTLRVPVICCGDIFDIPISPPELVNFALEYLPTLYSVAGNHDLPNHSYAQIHRSSFHTLVLSGRVIPLHFGQPVEIPGAHPLRLWGFPWRQDPEPLTGGVSLLQEVAVVHRYTWTRTAGYSTGYKDAPESHSLDALRSMVQGYNAVFVGDNHIPFAARKKVPPVVNCGSLMRLAVDQKDHEPRVWIYHSDDSIEPHYLDCSRDVLTEDHRKPKKVLGGEIDLCLETLKRAPDAPPSYQEAVRQRLRIQPEDPRVEEILLTAIDRGSPRSGSR